MTEKGGLFKQKDLHFGIIDYHGMGASNFDRFFGNKDSNQV